MKNDLTIHKYQNVKLERLGYYTFHLEQASKHLMLINIEFLVLINPGTMNVKSRQSPLSSCYLRFCPIEDA